MALQDFDAIVAGMGPGGEVAAERLLSAGKRIAVIERELIGGECGYWACVPSKTLIRPTEARHAAARAAGLTRPELSWPQLRDYRDTMIRHLDDAKQVAGYEKLGATVIKGTARLAGPGQVEVQDGNGHPQRLRAGQIILATGSDPLRPSIDGLDDLGPDRVWTNREATSLAEIPERALVVGGSAVGVELGQFLARMGTHVTLVQRGPRLLDREEPRVGELTAGYLAADGIDIHLGTQVRRVRREGADTVAELDDGSIVRTGVIVLGAGRRPRAGGLGLDTVGVTLGPRGTVPVNENCRVGTEGLWAVGDITGIALFTHVAMYQARVAADTILGKQRTASYHGIPRVVFADPEVAAAGLTTGQARQRGIDVAAAEISLPDLLARPRTYDTDPTGYLGLLADRHARVLIGAWAIAPLAGEWIHQAAQAIRAQIPLEVLLDSVAQFPTYSEAYLKAVEKLGA